MWVGDPDPLSTKDNLEDHDESDRLLVLLHEAVDEVCTTHGGPMPAREMVQLAETSPSDFPKMFDLLDELDSRMPRAKAIGYALRKAKGSNLDGRCIDNGREGNNRRNWSVVVREFTPIQDEETCNEES